MPEPELRSLDLPQGTVEYRTAGPQDASAPTVVFVHGAIVNAELWSAVADLLAEHGIRSIAPDLPLGSHRLPLREGTPTGPREVAALVGDVLAALELTDVTLVGNDTGGALCQFLVDAELRAGGEGRVGRLVLTNCDAFDKFPPAPFNALVALGRSERRLRALVAGMRAKAIRHSVLGYGALVSGPLDEDLTRRWVQPLLTDAGVRRDLAAFFRALDPNDLLDVSTRLGGFTRPVTLVWGTADRFFRLDFARRLADVFPDATLVEVAGARTFVALDAPQRLADEIRAALVRAA